MEGKRVIITGSTSGIGRATALALGQLGAKLILVSRDFSAGNALVHRINKNGTDSHAEFISTDLSNLKQVLATADRIRERWTSIDILINNAGARFDTYASTEDGFERTFATNHLGHFLLTNLLIDRLTAALTARVISVSSSAAAQALADGHWQYDEASYDRKQAYAKSKLANLLFAFELARRFAQTKVVSMAVDPGVVATRFASNNGLLPWLKHLFYHGRRRELTRPAQGADTIIYLSSATSLPASANGKYFRNRAEIGACAAANDPELASKLWSLSVKLAGLKQT